MFACGFRIGVEWREGWAVVLEVLGARDGIVLEAEYEVETGMARMDLGFGMGGAKYEAFWFRV